MGLLGELEGGKKAGVRMATSREEGQRHKEQGRKNFKLFRLLIKGCTVKESAAAIHVFWSF